METRWREAPALPDWLEAEMPFGRKLAELNDGTLCRRLHVVDHGEGPVVVLVHGNPTWSFLWRKVIARLDGFRCVAPDLLGLGLSDKPLRPRTHQLAWHVAHIEQVVRAATDEPVIVVGQDWGGPIAAGVARRLGERVAGVVFGNTGVIRPRRPLKTKAFHRFSRMPLISDAVFRLGGFPQRGFLGRAQGDPASIGALEARAYQWPLRRVRDRAAPLGLARMVPNHEGHPSIVEMDAIGAWVEQFRGPSALVWGLRDPILGRGLRRHRSALPTAEVWETDAGHFSQEECPDTWAAAIRFVADAASKDVAVL